MSCIDLHSHSTVSDGSLAPADLIRHAAQQGVKVLALTDHDDVAGLSAARTAAQSVGISLIAGAEISVTWRDRTLHIVGLKIDPHYPEMQQGLRAIRDGRVGRAAKIAEALAQSGIDGSLEGAYGFVRENIISRTHFACFLVSRGYAGNMKNVFKKFLVKGRPGYVPHRWAALADVVRWIKDSGGRAVLAHPGRYGLGGTTLRQLLEEFRALGGDALEVVSGSHTPEMTQRFAGLAAEYGFLASCGSDYHGPDRGYGEIGRIPPLPPGCAPVWHDWPEAAVLAVSAA